MGRQSALFAAGAAAILTSAVASAASAAAPTCAAGDSLLFAFFGPVEALYYATSPDGLIWTVLNKKLPVLKANITPTSMRDNYLNVAPDGSYRLVTTNGVGFGNTPTFLTWSSKDLINWSEETIITAMGPDFFPAPAKVTDLWAPEWQWDAATNQYMVFWAARGSGLLPPEVTGPCNSTNAARFTFWRSWTTDFKNISKPVMFFDPGCNVTAPVGDGGIDGDLVQDENGAWVFVYKDARGPNENVRGVRTARSSTGRIEGPYLDSSISGLLAQTLVEGPQLVFFQDQWLLYYDCSFVKTPAGWPRPPYGVSVSPSLAAPAFRELPGACTGNSSSMVFPHGATHGSFFCISEATRERVTAAFPV